MKTFRVVYIMLGVVCVPFAFHFGCVGPEPERVEQEPEHAVLADHCNCTDGCNCLKLFDNGKTCKCQVTNEKCCDGCKCLPDAEPAEPVPLTEEEFRRLQETLLRDKITPYFCPRCRAKTWMKWGKPEPAGVECGACSRQGVQQKVRHPLPADGASIDYMPTDLNRPEWRVTPNRWRPTTQKKTERVSC